ncbi:MAG: LD-carboxypeptidase [Myxococcota bacterium]
MKILPMAVSSPFIAERYEAGAQVLKSRGHEFMFEPKARESVRGYLNGSDVERLAELTNALKSKADLVWAVRGGYGLTRLLPDLDLSGVAKFPVAVGFSDTSALLMHLWSRYKAKSLHARCVEKLEAESDESLQALDLILAGQAKQIKYPKFDASIESGNLEGILLAANLAVLTALVGTESMPKLEGCILILEDVNEPVYKLDRMFTQLWASGALKGVVAIVVGYLTECGDRPEQVFLERCADLGIPCFTGFPMGHQSPNWPVPVGVQARIQTTEGSACLQILEELF